MAIPDFQSLMLPLLRIVSDQKEHLLREAITSLGDEFSLTEEERRVLLPSGRQAVFHNRVSWAKTHLLKAGLLEATRRGAFVITKRGSDVLQKSPPKINIKYLEQFEEFVDFRTRSNEAADDIDERPAEILGNQTPEEAIEAAYQRVKTELAADLLSRVKGNTPDFFEKLVVDLLVKMGYGGTRQDAGKAVGKSGDEGIDGIINEDRLGLDTIYIQAKKWDTTTVGRPEIQKFAGALQGQRAKKGIFITTSEFSQEAYDYVSRIDNKIILINGKQLASLMIDYGVGAATLATYEIKRVDSDYFADE